MDCPAGLLIDGAVEPLTVYRVESEGITYGSSLGALRRAAMAQYVSGRICSDELAFDADDLLALRELVRRTDEELAWTRAQVASSSTPAATPDGATPMR
ncbi:MAG: hypothetical protein H5U40_01525 [Polyangiaceae bacterium]|nr:hypothetical protein [Polyangiaceae bacterium]